MKKLNFADSCSLLTEVHEMDLELISRVLQKSIWNFLESWKNTMDMLLARSYKASVF
jgi:hypothetical protein